MRGNTETGRPYGGETPEQRAMRRREQLLDAGLELFGTIGYRATTVRMLARESRVTDRYFYESFSNTEDLLVAVYRRCIEQIRDTVLAALSSDPDLEVDRLAPLALDAFFNAVEDPRVARVCWVEILGISRRVDQVYGQGLREFADLVLQVFRDRFPRWKVGDEEGRLVALTLIGGVNQATVEWLLTDYQTPREVLVAATARVLSGTTRLIADEQ
ncbi:MAG TPA: TetR/AcrR family transcriptional regulator [Flexivirga sp.]|uniref:TetR/AcrR family transcriptional regulator n=1 Tax=Flexivirga sp. TaxID=1962927 RepID=UPI002B7384C4|nr:TetR/AcrR family transcriptional regulator [Flexivirga sp.]HWC21251.1 TetR/AcrR family transcriptional regulator [Flexivirga sp.]